VLCLVRSQSLFDDVTPEAFLIMDYTTPHSPNSPTVAFSLLSYYSPEPERYPQPWTKVKLLDRWQRIYPTQWICWALIESIYQGRYKTYCVEQILALWLRRGEPLYHFNSEFEAMICHKVPQRVESSPVIDKQAALPSTVAVDESFLPSALDEEGSENLSEPVPSDNAAKILMPESIVGESEVDWIDAFEQPVKQTREFDLVSVLSRHQLLPLTFDRIGLEPIHRFMPEAEPVEFCEKLAAIAATQESARSHH
jgi:hypothetical protein